MSEHLGSLPPGDVGYFGVDWTEIIAAVAGDALDGDPQITCSSAALSIDRLRTMNGVSTFNASSDVEGTYELLARVALEPSGRRVSQTLVLVVGLPPALEPVTLDEARKHLRLDVSGDPPQHPEDDLILGWIRAAREKVELATGLTLVRTPAVDYRDSWPMEHERYGSRRHVDPLRDWIRDPGRFRGGSVSFLLDKTPVVSIQAIKYVDVNGVLQVLPADQYQLVPDAGRMRVQTAAMTSWPSVQRESGAIRIEYTAGPTGPIAESLRSAIKLVLAVLYENRGSYDADKPPQGLEELIQGYRILV